MQYSINRTSTIAHKLLIAVLLVALFQSTGGTTPAAADIADEEDIVDPYWTTEKILSARPMPLPDIRATFRSDNLSPEVPRLPTCYGEGLTNDPYLNALLYCNGPGDVPAGAPTDLDPFNHPNNGWPYWMGVINNDTYPYASWPWKINGKLFLDTPNGSSACSATAVTTVKGDHPGNKNLLFTAGHCVHPGAPTNADFYTNLRFAPGYRVVNGQPKSVCQMWEVAPGRAYAPAWRRSGGNPIYDYAVLVVKPKRCKDGNTWNLHGKTGSSYVTFNQDPIYYRAPPGEPKVRREYWGHGYPGEPTHDHRGYDGRRLWQCYSTFWQYYEGDTDLIQIGCDHYRGSSGGGAFSPWKNNDKPTLLTVVANAAVDDDNYNPPLVRNAVLPRFRNNAEDLWLLTRNVDPTP